MAKKELLDLLEGSTKFKVDVAAVVLRNTPKVKNYIFRLKKEKIHHMVVGEETSLLICGKKLASKIRKDLEKYVLFFKSDLTALTIKSDDKVLETPGFLAYLTNKISKKGINIVQILTNYNNMTLIVDRKDLFSLMDTLGLFK